MYKIAVLGDRDSIYGFAALGLEIFPVQDKEAGARTLRQLEENGLVERIPDPGDHRKALVRLTDKGEAIRLKAEDRMREYMHRVIDRVGEETFARMLDDLSTWEQAMQAELAREE